MPSVSALQLETQQVCIPHHVPFPVDDSDVCLILLSDLLEHPFDPTLASMYWVFHHGVSPPVKLVPPQHPRVLHAVYATRVSIVFLSVLYILISGTICSAFCPRLYH